MTTSTLPAAIDAYVAHLNTLLPDYAEFRAERLSKYTKIIGRLGGQDSVHSFIENASGDVLKAATWKAPAKGARGTLATEEGLADIIARADWTGRYLCLR